MNVFTKIWNAVKSFFTSEATKLKAQLADTEAELVKLKAEVAANEAAFAAHVKADQSTIVADVEKAAPVIEAVATIA